jgi:hypothetical protein
MAWEVYTRQVIRTGEPAVTITKMGRIALNKLASELLERASASHVQILWDSESFKCGIKVSSSKDAGAYKLTAGFNGNGAGFSAVTFLNYIRYDWTITRSFNAEWDEPDRLLAFSIPKEHFGASGDRKQPLGRLKRSDRVKATSKEQGELLPQT